MSLYRFECLNHFIGSKIEGLSVCDCCLVMFEMFLLYMIAFVALITCQKTKIILNYFVEYFNNLHISLIIWEKVMTYFSH